jgi:hypothetical protein
VVAVGQRTAGKLQQVRPLVRCLPGVREEQAAGKGQPRPGARRQASSHSCLAGDGAPPLQLVLTDSVLPVPPPPLSYLPSHPVASHAPRHQASATATRLRLPSLLSAGGGSGSSLLTKERRICLHYLTSGSSSGAMCVPGEVAFSIHDAPCFFRLRPREGAGWPLLFSLVITSPPGGINRLSG